MFPRKFGFPRRFGPCLFLVACSVHTLSADVPPNIVLVVTDDQGYGDLGVTGNSIVRTPRIDALAAESATMTNFYVSPVCSPTRACLMTGRYNYRTRVVDTYRGRSIIDPDEITIAEMLDQIGYATGIFGKWHLGDNHPSRPIDQGFETAWVHRGGGLAQPSEPIENELRYTDPILIHNGKPTPTEGYCTDVYFDKAIEFIDDASISDRPFFAYVATNAPHGPFHDVPEEKLAYYAQQDMSAIGIDSSAGADVTARTFAMIENIDDNVGRLLDHLDRRNLSGDTLVIFMVDNGPAQGRYVGEFRGRKGGVNEGGIRSPFFARLPGRFDPSTRCDAIAAHIDVMPTLLDLAGVSPPERAVLDGRSLLPMLDGETTTWTDDRMLVLQSHRGNVPQRRHHFALRTARWKLSHSTGFGRETMPPDVPYRLYDVTDDPAESDDLADRHPGVVRGLLARYDRWFESVSTTRPSPFEPPRMTVGRRDLPATTLTPQDWRVQPVTAGYGIAGTWKLNHVAAGDVRLRIRFDRPIDGAAVMLEENGSPSIAIKPTLAPESLPGRPVVEATRAWPAGAIDLRVWASRGDEVQSVYDVDVLPAN